MATGGRRVPRTSPPSVGLDFARAWCPWALNFGDLDGDGWLDFYLGTGNVFRLRGLDAEPDVPQPRRPQTLRQDVTRWPAGFGHLQKGHGVAFADFDHDGDQDVVVEMGGAFLGDAFGNALFENPGNGNHWITLQLVGTDSNRSAIGARIRCFVAGVESEGVEEGADDENRAPRTITKFVNSGGSFGASPLRQTLGLGRAGGPITVEVFWPTTGATQVFEGVAPDRAYRLVEGEEELQLLFEPARDGDPVNQ